MTSPRPEIICPRCGNPTSDWYVIDERDHRRRGQLECSGCHESRVHVETLEKIYPTKFPAFRDRASEAQA